MSIGNNFPRVLPPSIQTPLTSKSDGVSTADSSSVTTGQEHLDLTKLREKILSPNNPQPKLTAKEEKVLAETLIESCGESHKLETIDADTTIDVMKDLIKKSQQNLPNKTFFSLPKSPPDTANLFKLAVRECLGREVKLTQHKSIFDAMVAARVPDPAKIFSDKDLKKFQAGSTAGYPQNLKEEALLLLEKKYAEESISVTTHNEEWDDEDWEAGWHYIMGHDTDKEEESYYMNLDQIHAAGSQKSKVEQSQDDVYAKLDDFTTVANKKRKVENDETQQSTRL